MDALFESEKGPSNQLRGVVLGGGKAKVDRPLGLKVREENVPASTSMRISRAINDRFDTDDATGKKGVAEPKTNRDIVLLVPENYRQNIGRYLGVVKNIAYSESATDRVNRLEALEQEDRGAIKGRFGCDPIGGTWRRRSSGIKTRVAAP